MPFPKIDAANARKPLAYDPLRKKFILLQEIISQNEAIIPVDSLSEEDLKQLVIERQLTGPDYKIQSISGKPMSRDDVVEAIRLNQPVGRMMLEAEKSCLRDLQTTIQNELQDRSPD